MLKAWETVVPYLVKWHPEYSQLSHQYSEMIYFQWYNAELPPLEQVCAGRPHLEALLSRKGHGIDKAQLKD